MIIMIIMIIIIMICQVVWRNWTVASEFAGSKTLDTQMHLVECFTAYYQATKVGGVL